MELSGDPLDRVSSIFWCKAGANTNDQIQAMEREVAPKMSRHYSAMSMNEKLFARIDDLYQRRATLGLNPETLRLVEKSWKGFVKSGAKLDADGKKRLAAINEELSSLGIAFSQNVLADEKEWVMFLGADDLAGLPDFLKSAMAGAAAERGRAGDYAVTLSRSIYEPFTTFSERRDLREKAFKAFIGRGETGGATDNAPVVAKMLALRAEKAKLLGYESFAALKLDDTMAKTPSRPCARSARDPCGTERGPPRRGATTAELSQTDRRGDRPATTNVTRGGRGAHYSRRRLRAATIRLSDDAELKPYLQLEPHHRRLPFVRRRASVRASTVAEARRACAGPGTPTSGCFRGCSDAERQAGIAHLSRRLFRAPLQTVRRVDERRCRRGISRPPTAMPRAQIADHLQRHELRQGRRTAKPSTHCRSTRRARCSTNSATPCTAC